MKRKVTYGPALGVTRGEQHRRRQALIARQRAAQQSVHLTTGNVPPNQVIEREGFYLFGIWFNRKPRGK